MHAMHISAAAAIDTVKQFFAILSDAEALGFVFENEPEGIRKTFKEKATRARSLIAVSQPDGNLCFEIHRFLQDVTVKRNLLTGLPDWIKSNFSEVLSIADQSCLIAARSVLNP